ncbi:GNAT family N-acetyltransferase [Glycomyces sp. A-F 0318]|uniref:GNAT family N-acetyltransferase n=1 Tax=Glycomyces amatae TaxID=2881355 RepID=UPI001E5D06D3|nr:GNAT family N-acetyltransferase [Glycomyces amatae]MCD0442335.1 GNAT family N-acetyltransferase [Glycomyces amatae]
MNQQRRHPSGGPGVAHGAVTVPLTVRDLTRDDLADCEWSGGPLHLAAVAGELVRAEIGDIDYLALCTPSGPPVAIGGVDFTLFTDAGYLWQLAVHPLLQRCGIGTLLVAALEDRARGRGRFRAELRYEQHEAGNRAFYERLGYTAYGTVPDGWDQQLPDGRIRRYETTCVQMRRELQPPEPRS